VGVWGGGEVGGVQVQAVGARPPQTHGHLELCGGWGGVGGGRWW